MYGVSNGEVGWCRAASITIDGKRRRLGTFADEEQATAAYAAAAAVRKPRSTDPRGPWHPSLYVMHCKYLTHLTGRGVGVYTHPPCKIYTVTCDVS